MIPKCLIRRDLTKKSAEDGVFRQGFSEVPNKLYTIKETTMPNLSAVTHILA